MLKTLAAIALALAPTLAEAGNRSQKIYQSWWTVKEAIDREIGFTGAVATVWDCSYSACERRIAEWYLPERNLYVRWEGYTLTQGPVCEALDCNLVASLTGGERPRYNPAWK